MTPCPGLSSAESPWLNGTPWSPPGLPLQHTKTWVQDDENNNNDENNNDDENNNNDDHNNDNNKNTTLKTRSQETYQKQNHEQESCTCIYGYLSHLHVYSESQKILTRKAQFQR